MAPQSATLATEGAASQQDGVPCVAATEPVLATKPISALHEAFYPLHAAAFSGDVEKLASLLESGMNQDHADFAGLTPLHIAAGSGNANMVRVLLEAKAQVAVADRAGAYPLALALDSQASEVETLLRDAGASEGMKLVSTKAPINPESQAALRAACGLEPMEVAAMQSAWSLLTSQHKPQDSNATVSSLAMAFFTLLFKEYPDLLEFFEFKGGPDGPDTVEMEKHAVRVLRTVGKLLDLLDDFPALARVATGLTKRHVGYGVQLEHYNQVLGTLALFLSTGLGDLGLWNDQQASAWTKLVGLVKAVAAGAYEEAATAAANKA